MRMDRADRAKQFAPFDALRGLREALAEKEREHERQERALLSEEQQEELSRALAVARAGDEAEALCYEDGFYIRVRGRIARIDLSLRFVQIGEGRIPFADLFGLKIVRRGWGGEGEG